MYPDIFERAGFVFIRVIKCVKRNRLPSRYTKTLNKLIKFRFRKKFVKIVYFQFLEYSCFIGPDC
jgi:hypothetical protein